MTSPNPKVASTPKGFRSISPSISVADVSAAIDFYTTAMKGEVTEKLTAPDSDVVLFAQVKIAGTTILLTLDTLALPTAGTGHVSLHHYVDTIEETYDAAIEAGAVSVSQITSTWWGDLNAMLVDPFGVRWNLAKRVERLSADERDQRLRALYLSKLPTDVSADAEQDTPEAPEAPAPVAAVEEPKQSKTASNA